MSKHEERARELKSMGNNCSVSLHQAFSEDMELNSNYPQPRSIDGKCGALLTTEYILKNIGREDLIDEYDELFLKKFGSLKCVDLMRKDRRCNDYVGESAKYISEII